MNQYHKMKKNTKFMTVLHLNSTVSIQYESKLLIANNNNKQESLTNAKVRARQQCLYKGSLELELELDC